MIYLFVDGLAERLHLGQPREAVLAAWGVLADGHKVLLHFAPGEQGGHGELPRVLPRPAPARLARSVAGRLRRRAWSDPHDRGMLPALGAPALPRPQAARISGRSSRRAPLPATRPPRPRLPACCRTTSRRPMAPPCRLRWRACRTTSKRALRISASHSRIGGRSAPPICSSGFRRGAATHQGHPLCIRRARRAQADVRRSDLSG